MEHAIEEFKIYTNDYVKISDNCTLKIDHTFRVMKLCEEIAKSLKLSDEDIFIASMCGLLHDIGRFEQWKRYQTFVDSTSTDHGDLGVEVLTENNLIRRFLPSDKYDFIILTSIEFHNKYNYPSNLSEKEKLFTKIIRDADKIDILYLYTIGHIVDNTNNEMFSDAVFKSLKNNKLIDRSIKKTRADVLAISLGFVFDINYKKSIEILKEKDYINKEIELYKTKSSNLELIKQLDEVKLVINEYIERRLNYVG